MESKSLFWADQLAEQVEARAKKEKLPAVVRCGQTPSGGKHIGNLNDVVRAYFVYKSLLERGVEAKFIHSSDDRDPLKDIPKKLADLEGNWHDSAKFPEMKNFLGKPLCRVPDPFKCCKSWAQHFTKVWEIGLNAIGMKPKIVSNNEYYKQGKFEPYIKKVFEKYEQAGKIAAKFQQTKSEDYIPFDAICPKCGTLTNISSFDLKAKKVFFTCGGKAIKKKTAEGCGFEGSVPWSEGKLQWRFEWPAQWAIEKTTFEPMGKDHWEGSWKSGEVIAREIFEIEPPIPYVYEFFLVDGAKMSASVGNVIIVQDILKVIEPEIFLYFYTKRPGKQRDFSMKEIFRLADEFEDVEKKFFSKEKIEEHEAANIERSYFMSMEKVPKTLPVRIPYTFASMVAQIVPREKMLEKALALLKSTGHISGKLSEQDKKIILLRLERAKFWAENYAPAEYKIKLLDAPAAEIVSKLSTEQKLALHDLEKDLLKKEFSEKELYTRAMEIAKARGLEAKEFFSAAYLVLLGREQGPRLAQFILAVGQEEVAKRIEKI